MRPVNLQKESMGQHLDESVQAVFRDVGQILAEERKERNLTLKQVADQIHIRQRYLMDLEEGQLADLPGFVYVFGFIRTYARLLHLDGEELIRRIKGLPNLPDYERSHVPAPINSREEPDFPVLIVSIALVFVIAVVGYFFLKPAPVPVPKSQETPVNPFFIKEKPSGVQSPGQDDNTPSGTTPSNDHLIQAPNIAPIQEEVSTPAKGLSSYAPRKKLTLKAKEPSWVEIRDEADRIIFMKVMKSGEEYVVPDKPGITISTGNAGGLDIFLGETKLSPLGAHGDVKRGIRLEALQ